MASEDARTVVWEQIHLNDYCTYSYNKWKNTQEKCPFCLNIPTSKFHLTLECEITKTMGGPRASSSENTQSLCYRFGKGFWATWGFPKHHAEKLANIYPPTVHSHPRRSSIQKQERTL